MIRDPTGPSRAQPSSSATSFTALRSVFISLVLPFRPRASATGVSTRGATGSSGFSAPFAFLAAGFFFGSSSRYRKRVQLAMKGIGVFLPPNPKTSLPSARSRWISGVKSLSEDTRQKVFTFFV